MQIKRRNMWPNQVCPFLFPPFPISLFSCLPFSFSTFFHTFLLALSVRNRNDFECYLVWPEISLAAGQGQGSRRTGHSQGWGMSSRCLGLHSPPPRWHVARKLCVIYRQIVLRREVLGSQKVTPRIYWWAAAAGAAGALVVAFIPRFRLSLLLIKIAYAQQGVYLMPFDEQKKK